MTKQFLRIIIPFIAILFGLFIFLIFDFIYTYFSQPKIDESVVPEYSLEHGFYDLKPNFYAINFFGPYPYEVSTNEFGFRQDPNNQHKNYSHIFLGDSFTYGVNGPWEETFVGIYESLSGNRVLNAGVASYSPSGYLYKYESALNLGLLDQGHRVIIALDISDVQDEAGFWIDGNNHPIKSDNEMNHRIQTENISNFRNWIVDNLYFSTKILQYVWYEFLYGTTRINYLIESNRSAFTYKPWDILNQTAAYESNSGYLPLGVEGGLERIRFKINAISDLAKEHNADLYILIYPWPAQIIHEDSIFSWEQYANEICQEVDCVQVINGYSHLRSLARQDPNWLENYFHSWDIHLNQTSNEIIANLLLENIN